MPRVSVGKSGPIRAHCASEKQKKSDISIASSLETMNHASPALGIPLMGPDPRHGPASTACWPAGAKIAARQAELRSVATVQRCRRYTSGTHVGKDIVARIWRAAHGPPQPDSCASLRRKRILDSRCHAAARVWRGFTVFPTIVHSSPRCLRSNVKFEQRGEVSGPTPTTKFETIARRPATRIVFNWSKDAFTPWHRFEVGPM